MERIKLTDTFANTLPLPAKGKRLHMDSVFPNLGLRLTPGSRSWIVRISVANQNIERTIGSTQIYSASGARKIATEIAAELRQGVDRSKIAREQAERAQEELRNSVTMSDALTQYCERRTLSERTMSDYKSLLARELKDVANTQLREISREFAERLHVKIAHNHGKTRANHALRLVRALCKAMEQGLSNWDGFSWANTPPKKTQLKPEHGTIIWAALDGRRADSGARYIKALLLTGCRRGELADLKVTQVSLRNRTISLPKTKNGSAFSIFMSDQLIEVIEPLLKDKESTDLVFSGSGDPRKCLKACIEAAGVPFSLHSLRKLLAITMNRLGIQMPTAAACLNHTGGGNITLSAYAHATDDDMRLAWQAVADYYVPRSGVISLNLHRRETA